MDDVVVAGSVVVVVVESVFEVVAGSVVEVVAKKVGNFETNGGIDITTLGVIVIVVTVRHVPSASLKHETFFGSDVVVVVVVVVVNTVLASSQAASANVVAPLTFISDRIVKHIG